MAVFIDTGVFVAANNKSDKNYVRANELMRQALEGKYGAIYTSDYVIDESITTALARTHDHRIAISTGSYIIESPRIQKIYTDADDFETAWAKFQKLGKKPMSFTDCVSLSHIDKRNIGRIMSFDSEFDGLVARMS
ncbi:MAG: type II toxin-antitoxin system VapC family toxin [archaeon]|nr:type II toxin-antitoxin system VapC family toxin [archaeon]